MFLVRKNQLSRWMTDIWRRTRVCKFQSSGLIKEPLTSKQHLEKTRIISSPQARPLHLSWLISHQLCIPDNCMPAGLQWLQYFTAIYPSSRTVLKAWCSMCGEACIGAFSCVGDCTWCYRLYVNTPCIQNKKKLCILLRLQLAFFLTLSFTVSNWLS